jgi:hypothetical protein
MWTRINFSQAPCGLENFLFVSVLLILAGWSVLDTRLLILPILYIWEKSGFEPRALPQQAGKLPTLPPISVQLCLPSPSNLATNLPNLTTISLANNRSGTSASC